MKSISSVESSDLPVNVLFQAFCEARPREKVKEEPEIKKQRFTIRGVFGFASLPRALLALNERLSV
jgi:hypothetical protein